MIITELIDYLLEYRKGNVDVFNTLCTFKTEYDRLGDYQKGKLILNDDGLSRCAESWHKTFSKPYKFDDTSIKKYHEQVYNGDIEDMKQDIVYTLLEIFNDNEFIPETSREIYQKLKEIMAERLNDNIKFSVYARDIIVVDDEGEEYSLISNSPDISHIDSCYTRYSLKGVVSEIAAILRKHDVKELLSRSDADTQKKIIDLIYKYYDYRYDEAENITDLPKQKEMIEHYREEYGQEISQENFTNALNHIFKSLLELSVSYKDIEMNRGKFIGKNDNGL